METQIRVPLNTMLADLDESLRALLRRELARHGFDTVEIAFDAPDDEWSATLAGPTVNLFLYDLREAIEHRDLDWQPKRENGRGVELRPPLRMDVSYAVTAWTRAVQDEHRLLSQTLAILYAYPTIPQDVLEGTLRDDSAQRYPLSTRVAQERTIDRADFWTAVRGQYKAAIDYTVVLSAEPGTVVQRGPDVRTHTVRVLGESRSRVEEWHSLGGTVQDAEGEPVAGAWVAIPDAGGFAVTSGDGRFRIERVPAGEHRCLSRAPDGAEAEAKVSVPGRGVDLVVARPRAGRRR